MDERSKKMAQNNDFAPNNNPFKPMDMSRPSFSPFGPMPEGPSTGINNPFGGGLDNMDIDSIMKDLDEKFKELDRQEEKNKANELDLPKISEEAKEDVKPKDISLLEIKNDDKTEKEVNPVIKVDSDSKVIADNVVSDDEFFDDFFGDE